MPSDLNRSQRFLLASLAPGCAGCDFQDSNLRAHDPQGTNRCCRLDLWSRLLTMERSPPGTVETCPVPGRYRHQTTPDRTGYPRAHPGSPEPHAGEKGGSVVESIRYQASFPVAAASPTRPASATASVASRSIAVRVSIIGVREQRAPTRGGFTTAKALSGFRPTFTGLVVWVPSFAFQITTRRPGNSPTSGSRRSR